METIFVNKETKEALIKVYDLYTKDDIKLNKEFLPKEFVDLLKAIRTYEIFKLKGIDELPLGAVATSLYEWNLKMSEDGDFGVDEFYSEQEIFIKKLIGDSLSEEYLNKFLNYLQQLNTGEFWD